MRFETVPGGKRRALGSNGRSYTIGYALGQPRPWVLEDDVDNDGDMRRYSTLDDAISRAHEIEALKLGEDAGQREFLR
jgi:hypothetical protein